MTPSRKPVGYEVTDRGFRHYEPVDTSYGHQVQVYESSSARGPHVWLRIEQTEDTARRFGMRPEAATAHLTLDQAREIRDALDAVINNHYQLRD